MIFDLRHWVLTLFYYCTPDSSKMKEIADSFSNLKEHNQRMKEKIFPDGFWFQNQNIYSVWKITQKVSFCHIGKIPLKRLRDCGRFLSGVFTFHLTNSLPKIAYLTKIILKRFARSALRTSLTPLSKMFWTSETFLVIFKQGANFQLGLPPFHS